MREAYHDQLASIFTDLVDITRLVQLAVRDATEALFTADVRLCERVISDDAQIDAGRERLEEKAFQLLSLQQPVAGDLRTIVAALRMTSEIERMGDLAVHVAKIARLRVPEVAVPASAAPIVRRMAEVAEDMVGRAAQVIAGRDVEAAETLYRVDAEMDSLRRENFREILAADWPHGVEPAIDLALLGRYYERIADHSVSVANRVVFIVTGELPGKAD